MKQIQLNNIIDWLKDFTEDHHILKGFGFGPRVDSKDLEMPYMWVRPVDSPIVNTNTNSTITYNIEILIMDRIDRTGFNYADTLNDCNWLMTGLIMELRRNLIILDGKAKLNDNIPIDMVYETGDSNVNGCLALISIKTPIRFGPCDIPIGRRGEC